MNKTQFINYLKDGGKIEMIEFEGGEVTEKLKGIRQAEKVQTNAIKFVGGSWLYYSDIKADKFSEENGIVTTEWCKYKLIK